MRTKTLLLTAAVGAAGIASSMAQGTVFSVNAVGYVNTTLAPKYNLISNPLNASDNSIGSLFKNGIQGTLPDGFQVYKFTGTGFTTASWDEFTLTFQPPSAAALTVSPGEGVFVRNPGTTPLTVTFVGEVMQGNLLNPYPKGLSIRSSMVPVDGAPDTLGLKGKDGDQVYQFDTTTQKYKTSTFDEFTTAWSPALGTLKVGEAIFIRSPQGGSWDRQFTVQ